MRHFRRAVKNSSKKNHTFYCQAALSAAPSLSKCYLSFHQDCNLLTTTEAEKLNPMDTSTHHTSPLDFTTGNNLTARRAAASPHVTTWRRHATSPAMFGPDRPANFGDVLRLLRIPQDDVGWLFHLSAAASLTIWLNA